MQAGQRGAACTVSTAKKKDQNCFGPVMEVAAIQMGGVNECRV